MYILKFLNIILSGKKTKSRLKCSNLLIKIMSNAALYFISPLVRHVERSRMYIAQTFLDRCCWSQVLLDNVPLLLPLPAQEPRCWGCCLFYLHCCADPVNIKEKWVLRAESIKRIHFTCICHQRKLCQPLFAVTHEDTHIDHLDQWNENNRSCDPISIDQLETSAYLISCALREHFPGCWDMGQRYESSANSSRSQKTSRRFRFIHSL